MPRSPKPSSSPLQAQFAFIAELPEQSTTIADYSVPDHVQRELALLAGRKGRKASAAIEDLLLRECGTTLGAAARRVIAAGFLAERAERQRVFLQGIGLHRDEESPRYFLGSWTLSQQWAATGPVFTITGLRDAAGGSVSVRLAAKAFHRAASVLTAITRALGPGDYARPSASEWQRIWHGGRKDAAGLMAQLLASLTNDSTAGHERLLLEEGVACE